METLDPTIGQQALGQHSVFSAVLGSGLVVQSVLILLIFLSVWSWAIAIAKYLQYRRARSDSQAFSSIFWESKNLARIDDASRRLSSSPLAQVFVAGYHELSEIAQEGDGGRGRYENNSPDLSTLEHVLRRAEFEEGIKLEKGITFLATVASAAPFIGLFGTVWGIMNAFHGLSSAKSTTIQAVAPGISEALVATAIGLAAAIPAAVAYNYFAAGIKQFRESMSKFSDEFITVAKRYLQSR